MGGLLGLRQGLTVDVPAEEMMFHQHVLHTFLQRPLLLLLEKRGKLIVEIKPRKDRFPF